MIDSCGLLAIKSSISSTTVQTLASNEGASARWQPSHPGYGYISVQWRKVEMSSQHCKGPSLLSLRGTVVCHLHTDNYVVYVIMDD